jgi:hypothetical protein
LIDRRISEGVEKAQEIAAFLTVMERAVGAKAGSFSEFAKVFTF